MLITIHTTIMWRKIVPKQTKETRQCDKGGRNDLEKTHGFHLSTYAKVNFLWKVYEPNQQQACILGIK